MITSIKKRDGREIHFSPEKITRAIFLAASRVAQEEGSKADYETAEILTEKVVNLLNNTYQGTTPTVENVQDAVIKVLIETGHARSIYPVSCRTYKNPQHEDKADEIH